MKKRTFETKLGWVMLAYFMIILALIVGHWIMDAMGEDSAPVWMCHSMGNRHCGPDEPFISVNF